MNTHSLKVLEFDRFLERLGAYAASASARERLLALRPQPSPGAVAAERRLYDDALALRRLGLALPAARFASPEDALRHAAPERAVLDPEEFVALRELLETARSVRKFLLQERCAPAAGLQALAADLDDAADLGRAIERTFEGDHHRVRDSASDALRAIRTRLAALEESIRSRLERRLKSTDGDAFQDDFVTTRHGRYVLPVRRELRGRVPGIIHDQSNSGSTLFVEPEDVVEAGNELELLRLDERDEIRRILAALTAAVRDSADVIAANFELLCSYDMAWAVSAWGVEDDCRCVPAGERLRLARARHPLLQQRLRAADRLAELVPLDLELPEGRNVIVITGSNTGGKTVALKTIGLLTLIAQCGLPVPADAGSAVPFFTDVLADIGDEQSIEQSLSTFSAHLEHVVETLAAARAAPALVLLDELGAGTDPVEGGALACAILDTLTRAPGLTFATTHLGAVKRFVHTHPGMENASMLFDVETLRPQYRLTVGRAGASYALAIAERLGLPAEVIENAQGLLGADEVQMERMLSDLDRKQMALERELGELERVRDEAHSTREQARQDRLRTSEEWQALRKERRRMLHDAQGQAAALVENTRRDVERILQQARREPDTEEARELRRRLESRRRALGEGLRQTRPEPEQPPLAAVAVGDRVWVEFLKDHGTVAALGEGDRVTVESGSMRVELHLKDLSRARADALKPAARAPAVRVPEGPQGSTRELNLIGQRVEAALPLLDRFLDAALRAGEPEVRIVHGYGTGALRRAVHEFLHAGGWKDFRMGDEGKDPGGAGVTILTL